MVREGAEPLTDEFYERMFQNERARSFLDQERVQKRLRVSLRRWMTELFATLDEDAITPAIKRQIEVGEVHARIRLPIDLVQAGIRVLKRGMRRRIDFAPLDQSERMLAMVYVSDLLHLADSLMNQAYLHDVQEVVRNDEAYRLVLQKRGVIFERARQRAALSEWAEALFLSAWGPSKLPAGLLLRDSEFGIWMHHKGAVIFDDSDEYRSVIDAIQSMDRDFLPRLNDVGQERQHADSAIASIKSLLDLIRFRVNDLFEQAGGQDDGLDMETQLPDRRYLPSILNREMQTHMESGRDFCLLLIDVTFPTMEGASNTGTRSRLRQVAADVIAQCKRTTDHLFRYDASRFLLVAVECSRGKASDLAANLRERLQHGIHTGNVQGIWTPVNSHVAIGIVEYDRHPDYQYFIQRAETALAEASLGKGSRSSPAA